MISPCCMSKMHKHGMLPCEPTCICLILYTYDIRVTLADIAGMLDKND